MTITNIDFECRYIESHTKEKHYICHFAFLSENISQLNCPIRLEAILDVTIKFAS